MHGAHLREERLRHLGRGVGELPLDLSAFGVGRRVQRVGRRQCDQIGSQWISHASPRHLRSPRMASRIRDLMVARLAVSRSETWT